MELTIDQLQSVVTILVGLSDHDYVDGARVEACVHLNRVVEGATFDFNEHTGDIDVTPAF